MEDGGAGSKGVQGVNLDEWHKAGESMNEQETAGACVAEYGQNVYVDTSRRHYK